MEVIHVIVENLPKNQHWLVTWSPIFVSIFALIVSITSLRRTAKEAKDSSRPFLYTANISLPLNREGWMHDPCGVAVVVSNSPARLISASYLLQNNNGEDLYRYERADSIFYFPHDNSSAEHRFGTLAAEDIEPTMILKIRLKYTDLSGEQEYEYEANSIFEVKSGAWKISIQKAN